MSLTASKLRENIYKILDRVLETGQSVEIIRRGQKLRIVPEKSRSRLDKLKPREYLATDPEELVHIDWSVEWQEEST